MERSCTNCGRRWNQHTGTYCEHCGEPKPGGRQPVCCECGAAYDHRHYTVAEWQSGKCRQCFRAALKKAGVE